MEKYARQHLAEGVHNAEDLHVDCDSEIFRTLNSHYNRNNQLEVSPLSFRAQSEIKVFILFLLFGFFKFLFLDSAKFLLRDRGHAKRVLPRHSRSQRPRSFMEESHLQDNRSHGRCIARVFQVN